MPSILKPRKPSHPLQSCALHRRLRHILVNPNALGSITIALPHAVAVAEDLAPPDFSAALYGLEREAGGLEGGSPVRARDGHVHAVIANADVAEPKRDRDRRQREPLLGVARDQSSSFARTWPGTRYTATGSLPLSH